MISRFRLKQLAVCVALSLASSHGPGSTLAWGQPGLPQDIDRRIEGKITQRNATQGFVCRGERICGKALLPLFYQERGYQPVWLDAQGLNSKGAALLTLVRKSVEQGLQPLDYHLEPLDVLLLELHATSRLATQPDPSLWADMELLLTDAFLLLASHLSTGRVNPETLHADWVLAETDLDLLAVLKNALQHEQIEQAVEQLLPAHADYRRLYQARLDLMAVSRQGGWTQLPPGPTLRPGDMDNRIERLRQRLFLSGDAHQISTAGDPHRFDQELETAVRRFQQRHGLKADGLVGRRTLTALNVPVEARIRQIELNLERWRWLPRTLGRRYLRVNTADFKLEAVEDDRAVLEMRVVVGRPARRTPVFSTLMRHMVINPFWTVPDTIAKQDILPHLKENSGYLNRQGIRVFSGWEENAAEIDPQNIDWSLYSEDYFPFRLRQDPGPMNALGRMKFIFPNKFAVYLHDTPQRHLFDRVQRDFSSGCIRVEQPLALAAYLFKNVPGWRVENLQQMIDRKNRRVVTLPEPIPVHLFYMTAWADANGTFNFREDIYKRDLALDRALRKRSPRPSRLESGKTVVLAPAANLEFF